VRTCWACPCDYWLPEHPRIPYPHSFFFPLHLFSCSFSPARIHISTFAPPHLRVFSLDEISDIIVYTAFGVFFAMWVPTFIIAAGYFWRLTRLYRKEPYEGARHDSYGNRYPVGQPAL
jgi:hypothetical protein